MVPDPLNGNTPVYRLPQFAPTVGPSGACSPLTANAGHQLAVLVTLGDASVRPVGPRVTLQTWNAALTPSGNVTLGSDW
jgi:hypothetical protein